MIEKKSSEIDVFKDPRTGRLLALVIRRRFKGQKYNFLTAPESGIQLGVSSYKKGEQVQPHVHVEKEKIITDAQECIVVKRGQMVLYVFDFDKNFIGKTTLHAGDVAFQSSGGHGFKIMKNTQIVEVKQGPFGGDKDKNRFDYVMK